MKEVWKPIHWAPGYSISNKGQVRSKTKTLSQCMTNSGYLIVCLFVNKKQKTGYIHRLVAEAFIPNNNKKRNVINHKNFNKLDNSLQNLEWCTRQENHDHYANKIRKQNPMYGNKTRLVGMITKMARALSNAELVGLVHYISTLTPDKNTAVISE